MKCNKCENTLSNDLNFCHGCNKNINTDSLIISVGRSPKNSISIDNHVVSSTHANFIITQCGVSLEDLNSTNGTFVNGKKISKLEVNTKDKISFGTYSFDINEIEKIIKKSSDYFPDNFLISNNNNLIKIGRNQDNDLVINNIKVSRKHAVLEKIDGQWFIEDLNSSNGTFVNGNKIKKVPINPSDSIIIGGNPIDLLSIISGDVKELSNKISLSAENLTFSVNNKTIVDDISLTFLPNEFIGLIGPTGAGKTTLMMMINGATKPTEGDVYINSLSLYKNYESFRGSIGYVPQEDIIHRELKVAESLTYTANLRFSSKIAQDEINTQVSTIIDNLELTEARNTLIGNAEKKGISGGQRKRVNLGQELLTEPSILFLDEPTSGLDPRTDFEVMSTLKKISEKGKIVIITTHNITVDNFNLLTHLIVLTKGGKLAYFGPASEAMKYFGVEKPYDIFTKLNSKESNHWKEKYRKSDYYNTFVLARKVLTPANSNNHSNQTSSLFNSRMFSTLVKRYLKVKVRDTIGTLILLLQAPVIAIFLALVFNKEDQAASLFILSLTSIWFGFSNSAREIVTEQAIYKRERMVNLKISYYIFSKFLVLSLLCFLQSLILTLITYISLDYHFGVINLFGILFSISITALSMGLLLSSSVKTVEAAMSLKEILLIPQVVFGGLVKYYNEMNDMVKTIAAFTITRWGFSSVMIKSENTPVLNRIGFNDDKLWINFFVLLAFNLVFLVLTAFNLKRKDIA